MTMRNETLEEHLKYALNVEDDDSYDYPVRRIKSRIGFPHAYDTCRFIVEVDVPFVLGHPVTDRDRKDLANEILSNLEAEGIYGTVTQWEQ
jgi:hypothetical protein